MIGNEHDHLLATWGWHRNFLVPCAAAAWLTVPATNLRLGLYGNEAVPHQINRKTLQDSQCDADFFDERVRGFRSLMTQNRSLNRAGISLLPAGNSLIRRVGNWPTNQLIGHLFFGTSRSCTPDLLYEFPVKPP